MTEYNGPHAEVLRRSSKNVPAEGHACGMGQALGSLPTSVREAGGE